MYGNITLFTFYRSQARLASVSVLLAIASSLLPILPFSNCSQIYRYTLSPMPYMSFVILRLSPKVTTSFPGENEVLFFTLLGSPFSNMPYLASFCEVLLSHNVLPAAFLFMSTAVWLFLLRHPLHSLLKFSV